MIMINQIYDEKQNSELRRFKFLVTIVTIQLFFYFFPLLFLSEKYPRSTTYIQYAKTSLKGDVWSIFLP